MHLVITIDDVVTCSVHCRINPQDTITGFLLSGVGNIDIRKKSNFLVVDSSESGALECRIIAAVMWERWDSR